MKKKYDLSSTDEYVEIPSGWYGDATRFKPLFQKGLMAMKEYDCDLVEFFYAGEADDEGFIEPCTDGQAREIFLPGEEQGEQWCFKDGYDYDDRWRGPHFWVFFENEATLYWNAKYHDAEITLSFPIEDTISSDQSEEITDATA
jgi:hypothetical protein